MKSKRYKRYTSKFQDERTNSTERKDFEKKLIEDFLLLYQDNSNMNVKVDRQLFENILDDIGYRLQQFSQEVASKNDEYKDLHELMKNNPVPEIANQIMTKEFRVFCLALNALKQWVSAEQASMDRVLLGGEFKKKLKSKIQLCVVTNEALEYNEKGKVNFHHAMRDGRFPIPLTKKGHDNIEGQTANS